MSTPGAQGPPPDFRKDPEYVRERRQVIRDNHPDTGGSDARLIAALRELDSRWERRASVRRGMESVRLPGFIPDDVARQATEFAGRTSDEVLRRTEDLRARGAVIAHSPKTRRVMRAAGKFVRDADRTVRSRLPTSFPGARRFSDTGTDEKSNG
ncbi:hypothetical protein [Corynebacterium glyciniphilum]|uniref:hypothetical protein n=1 Tax=Corynebacterium glyciniphilum TaxID=1404244 RepID=UPI00264A56E5|nr:hypothetical protein [Corynebacterium glyciniphilum]MDN5682900.1 hypothetical protein [Corynebacterium glyciniphilum]